MAKKSNFAVLLLLLSFICYSVVSVADDVEEVRSWADAAAETLIEPVRTMYKQGLVEKGMAESDVETILQSYALHAAQCLAEAIQTVSEQEGTDFNSMVSADIPGYVNPAEISKGEFERIGQTCTLTALEKAGISIDE